uniref:DUF421 domain-containing protein n=1 Tax=Parerythrobacter lutipelagi TaxID=1964208 RepID=UPI0010F99B45|nr:YetF domain-containing protein [Parerythrobacter lutipelagi]
MIFADQPFLDAVARGALLGMFALALVVIFIRVIGLRSLSKMTNFDFVMTVALGSLVAGGAQATKWSGFWQVLAGMIGLFILQFIAAKLRKASDLAEDVMQNEPILLMRDGEFCDQAMKDERVTKSDVIAKLREANVLHLDEVRAVVLETTGDVSVLHGGKLDDRLIENVRSKSG